MRSRYIILFVYWGRTPLLLAVLEERVGSASGRRYMLPSTVFAKLDASKVPVMAAEAQNDRLLPFSLNQGTDALRIAPDQRIEYCDRLDKHPHRLCFPSSLAKPCPFHRIGLTVRKSSHFWGSKKCLYDLQTSIDRTIRNSRTLQRCHKSLNAKR